MLRDVLFEFVTSGHVPELLQYDSRTWPETNISTKLKKKVALEEKGHLIMW